MKTSDEAMSEEVDYCGPVKTSHKGFFLATLEKWMKEWTGGSHIVMKVTPRVPGDRPLMAIGYKYRPKKVLGFIATEGDRSTKWGVPYLYNYPGNYYNASICPVIFPHLIVRYSSACNAIDNYNRMRQSDIATEKYWVTQIGYLDLQLQWNWVCILQI